MVSGKQNLRDLPSAKIGWPGVLRTLEQADAETIVGRGLVVAQHPRQKSNDRIDKDDRSDGTVRQHIIADGNFLVHEVLDNSVIDPFVVAAEDNEMLFGREFASQGLLKAPTLRSHENDRARLLAEGLDRREKRFRLHDHPLSSTEGRVVDHVVTIIRPTPQIMNLQSERARRLRPAHHALA